MRVTLSARQAGDGDAPKVGTRGRKAVSRARAALAQARFAGSNQRRARRVAGPLAALAARPFQ